MSKLNNARIRVQHRQTIMRLGQATVYDVDVYAKRCRRGDCASGAVFLVDYPNATKPADQLETCADHLSAALKVVNE